MRLGSGNWLTDVFLLISPLKGCRGPGLARPGANSSI
jgi:hypothetical protein